MGPAGAVMGQTRFSVGTIDRWSAVAARPGVQSSAERSNRARIHVRCVALDRFVCRLVASTAGGLNRTNAGLANRVTATSTLQRAYLSVRNGVEQFSKTFSAQPVSGAAPPIGGGVPGGQIESNRRRPRR